MLKKMTLIFHNFSYGKRRGQMHEMTIGFSDAMDQAVGTAEYYVNKANRYLENWGKDYTIRDAIELAKIMSSDFNNTVMCIKLQEIRDAIEKISERLPE